MPISKSDQPIALDRAHLGSRLDRSRGQSSVLESWRSLGSPQLPGPSFPAYESPPTANRRVHWWGFTTLQDGSRRILPPVRLGVLTHLKGFGVETGTDLIVLLHLMGVQSLSVRKLGGTTAAFVGARPWCRTRTGHGSLYFGPGIGPCTELGPGCGLA